MPDGLVAKAFRGIQAVAIGVGLSAVSLPAAAAPDWELVDLRTQLRTLSKDLREDQTLRDQSVSEIVAPLALPELSELTDAIPAQIGDFEKASFGWTDKRHALAAMAQIYGAQNNVVVMEAGREGDTEALEVHSGVATLDQLRARLTARHLGRDIETGQDILRVPLIIRRDATLRLKNDEVLRLSNESGAFIVNFGHLEIIGGEIAATHPQDAEAKQFAPFIASIGSGTVHLSGATLRWLGFGYTAKFAGFSILAHPTRLPDRRNLIENSRFDTLVTVALVGVRHVEVRANRFFDMRRNPLLVSQSANALVENNLFSGDSPTNAVRVANGSSNTRVQRNIVLEGARAGLLVTSDSDNVRVAQNVIWRRDGGGVKLHHVRCGRVTENLILDDKQKGIEVRASSEALLDKNRIIGNKNAAVWVSSNPPDTVTYVVGNLIRENGSGLSAASGGDITMKSNDLSNQFPRFLDGDITHQFRAIIGDLRGQSAIRVNSGGVQPAGQLAPETCNH